MPQMPYLYFASWSPRAHLANTEVQQFNAKPIVLMVSKAHTLVAVFQSQLVRRILTLEIHYDN